jgi:hypothetical protein
VANKFMYSVSSRVYFFVSHGDIFVFFRFYSLRLGSISKETGDAIKDVYRAAVRYLKTMSLFIMS